MPVCLPYKIRPLFIFILHIQRRLIFHTYLNSVPTSIRPYVVCVSSLKHKFEGLSYYALEVWRRKLLDGMSCADSMWKGTPVRIFIELLIENN